MGELVEQPSLFSSDTYGALRELVEALGGKKQVGYELRPDIGPEKAGQWLRDALDPKRREVLPPHDLVVLLRMGQEAGIHDAMWSICENCGYERCKPVNLEQEVAELQKDFLRAVKALEALTGQIQRKSQELERRGPQRAERRQTERREIA